MDNTFKLEGVKEIEDILKQLPLKVQAGLMRQFNRKAVNQEYLKPLKSILPYSSVTKKSFKVQAVKEDKSAVIAGPTTDAYFVRWTEKGTKERETKSGAKRGKISGRNTVEPYADGRISPLIDFVNKEYGNEIDKFIKKKVKRLNKK